MSEETVVRLCAPTLAGMKTASLFAQEYASRQQVQGEVRQLNRVLVPRGLRAMPLHYGRRRALIYLYRPGRLRLDLRTEQAEAILRSRGYDPEKPEQCIRRLRLRLGAEGEFPHEIGLFLGYPPEDVAGFIGHGTCKCVGCWKVYGDEESAKKTFRQYKACTEVYCNRMRMGATLRELIVAG